MANNIRIPIGINKGTNKLVHVNDVQNGKDCNCYCPNCKADLIAVNRRVKQSAHFRHEKESNCTINLTFETYIHGLAKIIFKTIQKLKLPPITFLHFYEGPYSNSVIIDKLKEYLKSTGINDRFDIKRFGLLGRTFQTATEINVKECFIEKTYKTSLGDIRVDIVLNIEGMELFVEPFLSNPVDKEKLQKISSLDVSTISIDLREFLKEYEHDFTEEALTDYFVNNISSKGWVYLRQDKIDKIIAQVFTESFHLKLSTLKDSIEKNNDLIKKIAVYSEQLNELHFQKLTLERELLEINYNNLFD